MEKTIDRVLGLMMAMSAAATTALSLAYIAHYDFGLSPRRDSYTRRGRCRVIAMLVAVEFFGKKLQAQLIEAKAIRGSGVETSRLPP
jgi:hypothetical protein